jgi:hypothetical protein
MIGNVSAIPTTISSAASPAGEKEGGVRAANQELTPAAQREVARLQQIDREVRAHEQAHISAGRGVVTSGANFSYTYGPDGKQYAVGGEVGIDTSAEEKPEANIDKGIRIQAAALAPRDPSAQDYKVAAIGSQLEARGHAELAQQKREAVAEPADPARQRLEKLYAIEDNSPAFSAYA